MIANPLIQRELVGLLRTRRALAMLAGVAFGFGLLVVLRWPSDGMINRSGAGARQSLQVFGFGLTAAVTLLVPVFPATAVVSEKQRGTLALLLNSSLGPVRIYLGKLIAVLGFVALMLCATLPAVAACRMLGEFTFADQIVPLYVVLGLASLQYVTWALLVSTLATTTDGAVRGTFSGVLVMSVAVLIPHYFLQGTDTSLAWLASIIRNVSPVPAVMDVTGVGDVGAHGLISRVSHFQEFTLASVLLIVGFSGYTISRLNWSIFDRVRSQGAITDDQSTGVKVARRMFFLIDPQRRKKGIAPLVNPVMVKEFRSRQFGRMHWLLRLISACALISLGLAYGTTLGSEDWGVETIGAIIVSMQVALVVLLTPGISAGLISSERESGSWELLRMTPISAGAIVRGKLLSVVLTLVLILMATLPGYGVMIWIKPVLREQILQVMVCLTLTALFALMLSATVSSFFRRTAPATVTSYALLLSLWAGSLLVWLGRDAPFGFHTVQAALTINPLAAALSIIGASGFESYQLVPANWWMMGGGSVVLLVILIGQTRRLTRPV